MTNNLEVEVKIDEKIPNTKVLIYTKEMNEEIKTLVNKIYTTAENNLLGYKEDEVYILDIEKIELIYTEDKKVYARTEDDVFILRKRIFELEEMLSEMSFIRISNSEIANFKKVKSINFKLTGTIMLKLESGNKTFVSRRYIKKIREYLSI